MMKFIKMGTDKEHVWEQGNIGQFWKGTKPPPLGDPFRWVQELLTDSNEHVIEGLVDKKTRERSKVPFYCPISNNNLVSP